MDIKEAVLGSFGFPIDVVLDTPKIMIIGEGQVFVENFHALAEYKKDRIKLVTKLGIVEFSGRDFEIKVMKENNIAIIGKIMSIRIAGEEKSWES